MFEIPSRIPSAMLSSGNCFQRLYSEAAVSVNTRPYPEISGCKTKKAGFVSQYNDVFVGRRVDVQICQIAVLKYLVGNI